MPADAVVDILAFATVTLTGAYGAAEDPPQNNFPDRIFWTA